MHEGRKTPDGDLQALVRAIAGVLKVTRVVLHGSRATGLARQDSDDDLVVVACTDLPPEERTYRVHRATRLLGMPLDVLVVTPEEYQAMLCWKSSAVAIAEAEGKVIYEAA